MKIKLFFAINTLLVSFASAFAPANQGTLSRHTPCKTTPRPPQSTHIRKKAGFNLHALPIENVSLVLAEEGVATIRQYVALALILGVLIDIVLGSPIANAGKLFDARRRHCCLFIV